jgi:thymidylate synthase (FAD)
MKQLMQSFKVLTSEDHIKEMVKTIEYAGRNCYRSHDKITDNSHETFIKSIVNRGHESVLEHCSISVEITTDRGIMAEITRHRIASFSIESSRYCNYGKDKFGNEITFIKPNFWNDDDHIAKRLIWVETMNFIETQYMKLLELGAKPEEARSILPNSTKSTIVMTANLRSWRNYFNLRCDRSAHPQVREISVQILAKFYELVPVAFSDLYNRFCK